MSRKNEILHLKTTSNLLFKFKSSFFVVASFSEVIHFLFNAVYKSVVNNDCLEQQQSMMVLYNKDNNTSCNRDKFFFNTRCNRKKNLQNFFKFLVIKL